METHAIGTEAEAGPGVAPRPRAKRAAPPSAVEAGIPISAFGSVPADVTHWLIRRQTINGWEALGWAPPGAIAELREFPLSDLSELTIQERWGAGVFQIAWVRPLAGGGRKVLRAAREVRIVAPAPAVSPAPAPAAGSPFGGLDEALRVIGIINREADAKIAGLAQLATMLGGGQSRGLSGEELRAILRDEREASTRALGELEQRLQARIEGLALEDDDDDDDDDDGDAMARAASAVVAPIFRGKKWWQQVGAYASQNPEVVKQVLPVVVGAVQTIASAVAPSVPPPPPAAPLPALRPRAVQVAPPPAPPAPIEPPPVVEAPTAVEIPPPPPASVAVAS